MASFSFTVLSYGRVVFFATLLACVVAIVVITFKDNTEQYELLNTMYKNAQEQRSLLAERLDRSNARVVVLERLVLTRNRELDELTRGGGGGGGGGDGER